MLLVHGHAPHAVRGDGRARVAGHGAGLAAGDALLDLDGEGREALRRLLDPVALVLRVRRREVVDRVPQVRRGVEARLRELRAEAVVGDVEGREGEVLRRLDDGLCGRVEVERRVGAVAGS
jgi:hypothetical protein